MDTTEKDENANAVANHAVGAQHRAAGCFHALLSLLQKPLAAFVATARAIGPELSLKYELKYGLATSGLQKHLQFVSDHWTTHFQTAPLNLVEALRRDVEMVLQVQAQAFHAEDVEVNSYEVAIAAVLRLLVAVDTDDDTQRQAQVLKTVVLDWNPLRIIVSGSEPSVQQARTEHSKNSTQAPAPNDTADQLKASIATGIMLAGEGNMVAAESSFTKALKRLGDSAPAKIVSVLGHRARCRLELKQYEKTMADAREGLKLKVDWLEGHRLVCKALMGLERWQEARAECEAVLRGAPQDVIFQGLKQTIAAKIVTFPQPTKAAAVVPTVTQWQAQVKTFVQAGLAYVKKTKYAEADRSVTKALTALEALNGSSDVTIIKERVKALGHRARCRLAMESYQDAASDARAGIKLQPNWIDGHRLLCHALVAIAQWPEALDACQHVLKHTPKDTECLKYLAMLQDKCPRGLQEKPSTRARPLSPSSLPTTPQPTKTKITPHQLRAEGLALMASMDLAAAEMMFSDAIALLSIAPSKKHTTYYGERARCRVEMKKFPHAMDDVYKGLKCNPEWVEGYRILCRAFMGLDRWPQAQKMCERVLEASPHDAAFLTIKTQLEDMLVRKKAAASVVKPATQQVVAAVREAKQPRKDEVVSMDAVSAARKHELEHFAVHGSIVAQRFLYVQCCLQNARSLLQSGDFEDTLSAFNECRRALKRWPELEIPRDIADALRKVGSHDAIAWGGVMLYFHLQAATMVLDSYSAERDYWKQQVEAYPFDYHLHTKLAFVLYRGGETEAALEHVEKALWLDRMIACGPPPFITPARCWYLRAMCSPIEAASSPVSWLINVFSSQPEPRTRGKDLLKYFQDNTVDDEWMSHTCYTLGVLHVAKREYMEATQYFFLANEAEIRRSKLRLFPEINEHEFHDKALLRAAVGWPNRKLSLREEYEAVSRPITCTWCREEVRVNTLFEHKLEQCVNRPELQINIGARNTLRGFGHDRRVRP